MASILLVQVTQSLGGWEADQEVGMLLPFGQKTNPSRLEDGFVVLGMKRNIGDDFSNNGFDSCIVRIGLND